MFVMRDGACIQKCYRCAEFKAAEDFSWRRRARNQRDSFCRPCRAAYKQEHYQANKQRYIDRANAKRKDLFLQRTIYLIEYFSTHPCVDCGETDPVVLEFDHLRDKSFDVAQALPARNWQSILDEITKCEVVCANCHRRRTSRRRRALRVRLLELAAIEAEAGDRT